jgi:hypothetical protein
MPTTRPLSQHTRADAPSGATTPPLPTGLVRLVTTQLTQAAMYCVGLREQKNKDNAAWVDPRSDQPSYSDRVVWLRSRMREHGWKEGLPYCASYVGAVWSSVLDSLAQDPPSGTTREQWETAGRVWRSGLWTAHCMTNAAVWRTSLTRSPSEGAVWLACLHRRGVATTSGHTGVTLSLSRTGMTCAEANTSPGGRDNTGDGIYLRTRDLRSNGSLVTVGWLSVESVLRHLLLRQGGARS